MKKLFFVFSFLAVIVLVGSACSTVRPVAGATGKVGSKIGEASNSWFLIPIMTGDAGIATAAKKGGISTVGTVDLKTSWYLIYGSETTIVTGE